MEILSSWFPFITIVGVSCYYITKILKDQVNGKVDKVSLRLAYWLPTLPLVIGVLFGLAFHPLLPFPRLTLTGLLNGAGYGLVCSAFSSKIYEQAARKFDSVFGPVNTNKISKDQPAPAAEETKEP